MTLGQKIKKLRTEKGLTQKDLADKVYVTFQTVSKWEKDENEPDVATLRELAKLFDCSLDFLLSEDEVEEPKEEVTPVAVVPTVKETVVIHQKELHVCTRCKKDIPDGEVAIDHVCVRHASRGRSAEYRNDYYHKECLDIVNKEREAAAKKALKIETGKRRKTSYIWSTVAGVVTLTFFLLVFLIGGKNQIHPVLGVLYAFLLGYAGFATVYCILSGSYIADVFLAIASWSIKFPGVIFSFDIEGFLFLIAIKILFAILGAIISVITLLLAVVVSAAFAAVSFPFVLIHNERHHYDNM